MCISYFVPLNRESKVAVMPELLTSLTSLTEQLMSLSSSQTLVSVQLIHQLPASLPLCSIFLSLHTGQLSHYNVIVLMLLVCCSCNHCFDK